MRLIDADALIKRMPSVMDMQDVYLPIHLKELLIDDAPTVDAVPVIRCKDCKWYEFDRKMHCGLPHGVRSKDDYCSDAERKEE